jgi:hypothetical protein
VKRSRKSADLSKSDNVEEECVVVDGLSRGGLKRSSADLSESDVEEECVVDGLSRGGCVPASLFGV